MSISNLHRNSTEANKHTPKGFTDASNNSKLIRDERGESRYVDNINIGTFIDFADPTLPPPTTTNNHVYILVGAGTVDTDWGFSAENDIVRFFDDVPVAVTPTAGYFGYNLTENKYYKFETSWVEFMPVSENLANTDLEQMDLVRVFEVFEDGELKFITNHANSDAIFRVGENSEERFGEITLNSETFNQTVAVQNPTNDGQGIITRVNPNEFDIDSLDDITDVGTRRNRIYFNPQQTLLEHSEYGRIVFRQIALDGENIFEDLSPTKKGLQYNADYSADYTDRSLVDKAYVVANSGAQIYNGTDITPLTKRNKLRFSGYLEAVDDAGDAETQVDLSSTALKESNIARFALNSSDEVDLVIPENKLLTGDSNGFATTLTGTSGSLIGLGASNQVQEVTTIEAFNILKETGITADKTLDLIGIDTLSSNVKATFAIDEILLINTTANSVTVSVGSTALGTDVVNAVVVGANATVLCSLGTRYFSSTVNQDLYISSGAWNSANITISVTVKKIHYA